jgi:hypothetical protein
MLSQGFALDRTVDSSGTSQDVQWPTSRTCLLRNCAHDGSWTEADYDVFDDARHVGRIYLVGAPRGRENWFWGASFRVTKRKCYGYAPSLEEAKAAFTEDYFASQRLIAETRILRLQTPQPQPNKGAQEYRTKQSQEHLEALAALRHNNSIVGIRNSVSSNRPLDQRFDCGVFVMIVYLALMAIGLAAFCICANRYLCAFEVAVRLCWQP